MFQRLIVRICFKWSSWLLIGFLLFYIYGVALYFLYTSQNEVERYVRDEGDEGLGDHPVHDHLTANLPRGFKSWSEVKSYRQERYKKAQNRSPLIQGPGEDGLPVILSPEEQAEADKLFAKETFNVIASNKIALDRRIRDLRHPDCKAVTYPQELPTASVVIVFCNEAPSAILRTIHSVVNRSPPEFLHEIVLLDDASDRPDVGDEFEQTLQKSWPDGIVKLIRSKQRLGLIRARMTGADAASGDVLIFLDAHCEANIIWLEPILARIKSDRTIVICPMIDSINDKTMEFSQQGGLAVGGFSWALHFTWRSLPERERKRRQTEADPARSPTMAGGLFAIDRKYFYELGAYDPGMEVWGGENLEISFRAWMCGGSMEFLPCSRVGHIFRGSHPYTFPAKDSHGMNSKRLAEVWLDEYKRLYYHNRPDLIDKDAGNLTDRIELRKRLKCKSFKWFLDNVYPEKFIPDENVVGYGMIRNPASNLCLDTMNRDEKGEFELGLYYCQNGKSSAEVFSFSLEGEVRREEVCADALGSNGGVVMMRHCHGQKGNQFWRHFQNNGTIVHSSRLCLDRADINSGGSVVINTCSGADSQKWELEHYLSNNNS